MLVLAYILSFEPKGHLIDWLDLITANSLHETKLSIHLVSFIHQKTAPLDTFYDHLEMNDGQEHGFYITDISLKV